MSNFARNARMLWYVFATPKTTVMPVFISKPGRGKSALYELVAKALDAFYVDFSPAQMGPEDFNGMPWADSEKGLRMEMLQVLKQANAAPRAIINLDELSNVPRSTQAAMLRFIHTRRCGDYMLGDHVKMGGAMNPAASSADAQDISMPLRNRVCFLPWAETTNKEFVQFLLHGSDLDLPEQFTPQQHAESYRDTLAIFAAFLDRRGVLNEDPDDERVLARDPGAYASQRSWDAYIRIVATCRLYNDLDAIRTIGEGLVGPPQALEFTAFYIDSDLPAPEEWLKDATLFKHDPKRPDRTFAATTSLALAAVDEERTRGMKDAEKLARWNAAWNGLEYVMKQGADKTAVALAGQTLAMQRPKGALLASVQKLIEELAPVIKAAGFFRVAKSATN